MAKEILDIYVEKGYEYEFNLNFNSDTGTDLEPEYECWICIYFYRSKIKKDYC